MKDILFTVKQQKTEIKYMLACLLLAFGINIFAIISYNTEWKELHTQLFIVLIIAVVFYILSVIFRLIFALIFNKR